MTEKQTTQKKNDWLLKLLAVVCAVALWFYADAESNPLITKHFDVPVQYVNQAEGLAVEGGVQTARVTIRGKEADIYGLRSDDFSAFVDLSQAESGSGEYAVQVHAPSMVERFSVVPDRVQLEIDALQSKEVPVRVRTSGALPKGLKLEATEVQPETVTITGLGKHLEKLSVVETTAVDLSQLSGTTTLEVPLQLEEGITLPEKAVATVHFLIQEDRAQQGHSSYTAEIQFYHVPDGVNVALEQQTATVYLSGVSELLDNQQELSRIKLYVDCSGLQAGETQLPVQVEYGGSLTAGNVTPAVVRATVTVAEPPVIEENPPEQNGEENSNQNEGEGN